MLQHRRLVEYSGHCKGRAGQGEGLLAGVRAWLELRDCMGYVWQSQGMTQARQDL